MKRDVGGSGCGARGRGMNAPPKPPGGAGAPPGAYYDPLPGAAADGQGNPGLPESFAARCR